MIENTVADQQHLESDETQEQVDQPERGAAGDQQTEQEIDHAEDDHSEVDHPGREAAKYRKRLRETEGERDRLTAQLNEARWSIIENENQLRSVNPALLRQILPDPAELFANDGAVDHESMRKFVILLRDKYGVGGSSWGGQEGRSPAEPVRSPLDRAARTIMGSNG